MSYMHLNCIIVISNYVCNYVHLEYKFLCDFTQYNTRSAFCQKPLVNYARKNYINIILQLHVKFSTIPSNRIRDITTTRILGKRNNSAPCLATYTQMASFLFLMTYILYINFCAISSTRNRDQHVPNF